MTGSRAFASPKATTAVLAVSPTWIGDAVMCLPAIRQWRERNPDARLETVAKPGVLPFWMMCPDVNDVQRLDPGTQGLLRTASRLKTRDYRAAWVLPNSWRSALIPRLAGIPVRRGYCGHRFGLFLTDSLPNPPPDAHRHQSLWIRDLLLPGGTDSLPEPRLHVPGEADARMREALFELPGPRVVLIPGAARGESKRWPADRFAETGRQIHRKRGGSLIVSGAPGERALCETIARSCGGVNWAGRTDLPQWAALLKRSDLVICNDSGGMHLAAALGVAGIALFGLTDPAVTGPLGSRMKVVRAESPDRVSRTIARSDPRAARALESISVERVVREALEALEKSDYD